MHHPDISENNTVDSALLKIELDFVVLYANSLALRALQEKLRRRRRVCTSSSSVADTKANDLVYEYHSLLNLVEGPWILEALASARSIVDLTLTVLEERGVLRYCPSRVFPQILFATTFMYKVCRGSHSCKPLTLRPLQLELSTTASKAS